MSRRTVKPGVEERLDSFRQIDRTPSNADHHGTCACGAHTSRSVQGIGWQCRSCAEAELQRLFGSEIAERTQRERNEELVTRYLRKAI